MAEHPTDEAIRSTDEAPGEDHSIGRLILTYRRGVLRIFRIRDFADADTRESEGRGGFE